MLICVLPFLEPPFAEGGLFAIDLSFEGFLLVCLSTTAAFLVNFTIYWIIGNTSPITYNFFGHFKFCATMIGGVIIFNDALQVRFTKLTIEISNEKLRRTNTSEYSSPSSECSLTRT
jgi:solute carrier family 35 protein E3